MRRLSCVLCIFVFLPTALGCNSQFRAPPTYPHEDAAYLQPEDQPAGLDLDAPAPLVLLPGDVLTVRSVSNDSAEYAGLVVDSEGKVHVPSVGGIAVAGLAPHQAERTIEGMLQKQDKFVRVSVLVSAWTGHYAMVMGAVTSEGPKTLVPGMRLAELLSAAGGPQRLQQSAEANYVADLDASRLVRGGQALPVSLRLALAGDPRHNVLIHAADQLFVPAGLGNRIAVLGIGTVRGAMLLYRPGIRLTEALASAGALTIDADDEDIRVIRGPLKKPIVYKFDLDGLVSGKVTDVELAPGDVVFVTRHWSANAGEFLTRVMPVVSIALAALSTVMLFEQLKLQRDIRNELRQPQSAAATTPAP